MTSRSHLRSRLAALGSLGALALLALTAQTTLGGFTAKITDASDTAATNPYFTCAAADAAPDNTTNAYFEYPLTESSNATTATDVSSAGADGTYQSTMTSSTSTPKACPRDTGGAYQLNGTSSYLTTPTKITNPTTFTLVIWFKTTTAQGKIIGFGSSQTGSSGQYDRHIYLATTGQLMFGIYNGSTHILTSPLSYTDGAWHMVAATLSPTTGMTLYVDGVAVAANTSYTTPENDSGYWRIGYDNINGWTNQGSNYYFTGSLRYAAAYRTQLPATEIAAEYAAGH